MRGIYKKPEELSKLEAIEKSYRECLAFLESRCLAQYKVDTMPNRDATISSLNSGIEQLKKLMDWQQLFAAPVPQPS